MFGTWGHNFAVVASGQLTRGPENQIDAKSKTCIQLMPKSTNCFLII